jgi:hypothetical protein
MTGLKALLHYSENMSGSIKSTLRKSSYRWDHRALGNFFRKRREAAGYSISAVTDELDLKSPAILESFEQGSTPMPLEMVFVLTNLYNIAPEEILFMMFSLRDDIP